MLLTLADECTLGTHKCHSDSICTDTTSSYTCTCKSGYAGNGFYCGKSEKSSILSFDLLTFSNLLCFKKSG